MKTEFEKIVPNEGSSFKFLHFNVSLDAAPWHYHYHPEIELVCVVKGSGRRHVGNHISYFTNGDLVLIGSNLPHSGFGNGAIGEHEEIVIQLKPEILAQNFTNWPEFLAIENLLDRANQGIYFFGSTEKLVKSKLKKLIKCNEFERLICLLEVFNLLANSNDYELLNAVGKRYNFQKKDELRLSKILNFVEKNYENVISIKEVAAIANLTVPAFSAYFKKTMSVTFTDFVNEYRINQACGLLVSGKSVADVCFECGFNNISYFSRLFKALKGKSPSAFQKIILK
jgi:AraC-like DNA-binding protein/mannose-6-phosphate isomerase-like protein (cupin superfamily)